MAAEKLSSRVGQAWFCTTGLPSDVVIEVDEMSFHLHKVFHIDHNYQSYSVLIV